MKIIVVIVFILIVLSLGKALVHLVKYKSKEDSEKTMWALIARSGMSLLLFLVLFLAVLAGLVKPHGLKMRPVETTGKIWPGRIN
jgi:O-antigen/teichoic acid export membrane protein